MKKFKLIIALLFTMLLFPTQQAFANVVAGDFLGVFGGNDSESALNGLFPGLTFTQVAKVEPVPGSTDGLTVTGGPASGDWSYSGSELIDYLIVKASDEFAVYKYTDANTANMRNIGIWSTLALGSKDVSHISAYSVVPIPAAVWLFGCGLVGLFGIKRSQKTVNAV